jgi:hypothetical protein
MNENAVIRFAKALTDLIGQPDEGPIPVITSARYVTVALAAVKTGFTEKAIRKKIEDGVWVENREWKRSPDGRVLIDMDGYAQWVEMAAA